MYGGRRRRGREDETEEGKREATQKGVYVCVRHLLQLHDKGVLHSLSPLSHLPLPLYPLSTFPPSLTLSVSSISSISLSRYILSLLSLPSPPSPSHQYTFSELLSIVQASERELWDALDKQHACLIDGTLYNDIIIVMCTRIV